MLVLAVALHNLPEGMAVGLAFALAASGEGAVGAMALALGIGIQNFPEGAAVALPLRQEGQSRTRAFFGGTMSGAVEPVFGILGQPLNALAAELCRRRDALCGGRRAGPASPQPYRDLRLCDRLPYYDGPGRSPWLNEASGPGKHFK